MTPEGYLRTGMVSRCVWFLSFARCLFNVSRLKGKLIAGQFLPMLIAQTMVPHGRESTCAVLFRPITANNSTNTHSGIVNVISLSTCSKSGFPCIDSTVCRKLSFIVILQSKQCFARQVLSSPWVTPSRPEIRGKPGNCSPEIFKNMSSC